jgi:hypothetical protein
MERLASVLRIWGVLVIALGILSYFLLDVEGIEGPIAVLSVFCGVVILIIGYGLKLWARDRASRLRDEARQRRTAELMAVSTEELLRACKEALRDESIGGCIEIAGMDGTAEKILSAKTLTISELEGLLAEIYDGIKRHFPPLGGDEVWYHSELAVVSEVVSARS